VARPTTAARRYAEAAFELAKRDDALDKWRDDLRTANALLGEERVNRIVDNPALPFAERREVVDKLLDKRVGKPVRNLINLLAERRRLEILPAIVTSAAELSDDEQKALAERLRQMTGSDVELDVRIDEGLIGGLTVRVGD